jgi:hypothetical protein
MLQEGISREAFQTGLAADPRLRAILDDLVYGRIVRKLAIASASYGFLDGVIELAKREPTLRCALFDCVSAREPYKTIARETLKPRLALRLAGTVGASLFGFTSTRGAASRYSRARP